MKNATDLKIFEKTLFGKENRKAEVCSGRKTFKIHLLLKSPERFHF